MGFKKSVFILTLVMFLTGCSKLTKVNYEKLEVGMNQNEVSEVIGSSENCSKSMGTLTCIWGDEEDKHIKVRFIGDAAVTFSNHGL